MPHRYQVEEYSNSSGSLRSWKVLGFLRLFCLTVARRITPRSSIAAVSLAGSLTAAASINACRRIASQALARLHRGLPQTLHKSGQCCISTANSRDQRRTNCRATVEPVSSAISPSDFQRLNKSSVFQPYYPLCHSLYRPGTRVTRRGRGADGGCLFTSSSVSSARADTADRTSLAD
jgi:hypothetical protein